MLYMYMQPVSRHGLTTLAKEGALMADDTPIRFSVDRKWYQTSDMKWHEVERVCQKCKEPMIIKKGPGRPRKVCENCRPSQTASEPISDDEAVIRSIFDECLDNLSDEARKRIMESLRNKLQ